MKTKVCKRCGTEKDIENFNIRGDTKKYRNICKACERIYYSRETRKNNKIKKIEVERLFSQGLKYCSGCNSILGLDNFRKKKNDKYLSKCITCMHKYARELYNIDKYEIATRRKVRREARSQDELNKRALKASRYYIKNRGKILKMTNKYKIENRNKIKEYENRIEVKLANKIRKRIKRAIKNNVKIGKINNLIGCSVEELKQYLEQRFYLNSKTGKMMTWENYGLYGWHIDHIVPLSSFDLTNKEQFLQACHYTNLQPLWAEENLKKGSKLTWRKINGHI